MLIWSIQHIGQQELSACQRSEFNHNAQNAQKQAHYHHAERTDCLEEYMAQCYDLQPQDRLFPLNKSFLGREMAYGEKIAGVKHIRIHDLRHSHASLLVEMGFSPLLIAERLGHEHVQTTMEISSHLYPNKQAEVARQLDDMMSRI